MKNIILNNGVAIPPVGFGVYQITDFAECYRVVKDAIAIGYRLIDTAQYYGNEEAVGKAIKDCHVSREDLFITTKVWITNAGYEQAKKSMLESMDRMQLDYVDLMLIHQPYNDYYGTYRAMEEFYHAGKLRAIGVSNFFPSILSDLIHFNTVVPTINQIEINPFHHRLADELTHAKHNVVMQAWAPFAEGQHDIFNHPVLKGIGMKYKKTAAQVILRWLVQRNIIPLSKTVSKVRMQENFNIFDFILSPDDMVDIAKLDKQQTSFLNHHEAEGFEFLMQRVGLKG